jgi:tripartite ATP-independent transporter DctP family solute receptor
MFTKRITSIVPAFLFGSAVILSSSAAMAQNRALSFAYDQPQASGYGVAGDILDKKLRELSKGTMSINQYPGAQLGQEPQALQKIQTGDIDMVIVSTANASTIQPESGVFSIHYIFRDEDHLMKVLADPAVTAAMKELYASKVTGAHMLSLATLGFRDMYGKKEVHSVADLKGEKVRVQATMTEDRLFPAYGAQVVHMPFGDVYTSLQTGVVNFAENGVTVYLLNKHYEVAPVMSMTQHEANNSVIFVSDKAWKSFTPEQQKWVQEAASEVGKNEPAIALKMDHESEGKLTKLGVKIVKDVDKSGFSTISAPIQDELVKKLGPHAEKVLALVRGVK